MRRGFAPQSLLVYRPTRTTSSRRSQKRETASPTRDGPSSPYSARTGTGWRRKRIGWHSCRRGLSNLLRDNGVDVKGAQELPRHANSRITLDIYQRTVTDERGAAQEQVFKYLLEHQNLETRKHPKPAHKEEVLSGSA